MTSLFLATAQVDTAQAVRRVVLFGLGTVFWADLICGIAVVNASSEAACSRFRFATLSPHGNSAGLARGKFLVASQHLDDPNFLESVVVLLGYGRHGALGVIINRPTTVSLADIVPEAVHAKSGSGLLHMGGPVAHSMLLLLLRSTHHSNDIEPVFDDVYFSNSRMILQQRIDEHGCIFRIYSGHASWGPGQLDNEVARGDWHIVTADKETLFSKPSTKIWPDFIRGGGAKWVHKSVPLFNGQRRESAGS